MYKTCQANDLKVGQRIVNRTGDVWEVTAVVAGSKGRFGMATVTIKPLVAGMTGPQQPKQLQAKSRDVFTLAEFA